MLMLTELKVTTHWAVEHVFAGLDTVLLPMADVFNPTVNQTNGVHNVRLTSLFVSNVKPTLTESSSSQNIYAFALMDSMKIQMEHANPALLDAPSVHQLRNVMLVWLKLPAMETVHANALLELSLELRQMESDIANNVFNTVTSAITP